MKYEELFHMRHPNRLKMRRAGKQAPVESTKERAGRYHSAQPSASGSGTHRKWMQNFSLRNGPPLWLILKEG